MKTRPRGRPPKEAHLRKEGQLLIRVDSAEKDAFWEAAELAGLPLSAWVRERLRQIATRELANANRPVAFLKRVR